ncbi:MAG: hypothetical protein AAF992_14910 [Bacteroidota bacterium]
MSDKAAQQWKETRAKGHWKYAFVRGVLLWGLPVIIITSSLSLYYDSEVSLVRELLRALLICLGGFGTSLLFWQANEKGYQHYLEKKQNKLG